MIAAPADRQKEAFTFLSALYDGLECGFVALWTPGDKKTHWFPAGDLAHVAQKAVSLADASSVYFNTGVHPRALEAGQRGEAESVMALPGLHVDIDVFSPAHAKGNLPPTREDALALVRLFPHPPSWIVWSGHGLQCWWLFKEPWIFESGEEREEARTLLRRFQRWFQAKADERGWHVDSTSDLARLLRPPGTVNRKPGLPPVPVETLHGNESARYSPWDFNVLLPAVEDYAVRWEPRGDGNFPLVRVEPIMEGCAWMRHCRDDAKTLPEPEWFAMLSIVGRCVNGGELAHTLSKPYPRYDREETSEKLGHAVGDAGPRSCANIRCDLGGEPSCSQCPHWGKLRSPINLAPVIERPPKAREDEEAPPGGRAQSTGAVSPNGHHAGGAPKPEQAIPANPQHTDLGNAYRMALQHGDMLRWCDPWNSWLLWDGKRWARDVARVTESMAHRTIEALFHSALEIEDKAAREADVKWALKCQSDKAITAMVRRARAVNTFRSLPDQFDGNTFLLNVANGTIDLRTGVRHEHSQADYLTQLCPVAYDPHAAAPVWERSLLEMMSGRPLLVDFLRRALGYCLTGEDCEKVLFVLWGPKGDNGKSLFLDTFRAMLGDYGHKLPRTALMMRQTRAGQATPELAGLRGKRFAYLSEVDEGGRLDEALVKELTGLELITARDLFEKYSGFRPQFKAWIGTNYRPEIRGADDAIWRRLPVVPFETKFVETLPENHDPADASLRLMDKDLPRKLQLELPGILAWAVRGCLEWQRVGLQMPSEVLKATESYRAEMDFVQAFLDECCTKGPGLTRRLKEVHARYTTWASINNAPKLAQRALTPLIQQKGFTHSTSTGHAEYWDGLDLQAEDTPPPYGGSSCD